MSRGRGGDDVPFFVGCAAMGVGVVTLGLLVFMPATFLLVSAGFLRHPPLDRSWFFLRGVAAAIPFYGLLAFPRVRRWFRELKQSGLEADRLSAVPRIVLRLMLVLLFALSPLILANGLAFLNGALDESPAVAHETAVLEKTSSGGGKAPVRYALIVQGWRPGSASEKIGVSKEAFAAARIDGPVQVRTRAGRLGREWVASYHLGDFVRAK
jgi:hypothetical protein